MNDKTLLFELKKENKELNEAIDALDGKMWKLQQRN